jgi:hypothetical protein
VNPACVHTQLRVKETSHIIGRDVKHDSSTLLKFIVAIREHFGRREVQQ